MAPATARFEARRRMPPPEQCRAVREQAGMGMREMASAMGVAPSCVSRWERGLGRPQGDNVVAYVELLERLGEGRRDGRCGRCGAFDAVHDLVACLAPYVAA